MLLRKELCDNTSMFLSSHHKAPTRFHYPVVETILQKTSTLVEVGRSSSSIQALANQAVEQACNILAERRWHQFAMPDAECRRKESD